MTQFLPTFETASAHNRLMVTSPCIEVGTAVLDMGLSESERRAVQVGLARKRAVAEYLGGVSCNSSGESPESSSWDDLTGQTCDWLYNHLTAHAFDNYRATGSRSEDESKRHILNAGYTGIVTVSAFLEVIPRVLAGRDFQKPNSELAHISRCSKGFIVEWLGLNEFVDYPLAYALALKKPKKLEDVFNGLRFSSKWFCEKEGRVKLDPRKTANLRDETHRRHPSKHQPRGAVLLGCPARKMIPRLYDSMVNEAETNGLFEVTYESERRKYGLIEN